MEKQQSSCSNLCFSHRVFFRSHRNSFVQEQGPHLRISSNRMRHVQILNLPFTSYSLRHGSWLYLNFQCPLFSLHEINLICKNLRTAFGQKASGDCFYSLIFLKHLLINLEPHNFPNHKHFQCRHLRLIDNSQNIRHEILKDIYILLLICFQCVKMVKQMKKKEFQICQRIRYDLQYFIKKT